jgi:hypothetical protein
MEEAKREAGIVMKDGSAKCQEFKKLWCTPWDLNPEPTD